MRPANPRVYVASLGYFGDVIVAAASRITVARHAKRSFPEVPTMQDPDGSDGLHSGSRPNGRCSLFQMFEVRRHSFDTGTSWVAYTKPASHRARETGSHLREK